MLDSEHDKSVVLQGQSYPPPESLKKELVATVRRVIGPIATPDVIHVSRLHSQFHTRSSYESKRNGVRVPLDS